MSASRLDELGEACQNWTSDWNPPLLWKMISDFTVNPGTLLSSNHRYTVSSGCHLGPTKESWEFFVLPYLDSSKHITESYVWGIIHPAQLLARHFFKAWEFKKQQMHLSQEFPPYQDLVPKQGQNRLTTTKWSPTRNWTTIQSDFDLALRSQLHLICHANKEVLSQPKLSFSQHK